ncbi:uncharacterized protein LOC117120551 [Anneissia japonica]|uniref:uncharacterized protein LOC117120551 n=1 Tax=Anneissia japonica TaxID=1529436 RepID=UPI001425B70C|nr:uncharacterized protein LOC117120551 [Anneissia japonica]
MIMTEKKTRAYGGGRGGLSPLTTPQDQPSGESVPTGAGPQAGTEMPAAVESGSHGGHLPAMEGLQIGEAEDLLLASPPPSLQDPPLLPQQASEATLSFWEDVTLTKSGPIDDRGVFKAKVRQGEWTTTLLIRIGDRGETPLSRDARWYASDGLGGASWPATVMAGPDKQGIYTCSIPWQATSGKPTTLGIALSRFEAKRQPASGFGSWDIRFQDVPVAAARTPAGAGPASFAAAVAGVAMTGPPVPVRLSAGASAAAAPVRRNAADATSQCSSVTPAGAGEAAAPVRRDAADATSQRSSATLSTSVGSSDTGRGRVLAPSTGGRAIGRGFITYSAAGAAPAVVGSQAPPRQAPVQLPVEDRVTTALREAYNSLQRLHRAVAASRTLRRLKIIMSECLSIPVSYTHLDVYKRQGDWL